MGAVRVTSFGYLYFDFYYRGVRCREHTELKDTPPNRQLMEKALKSIDSEMRLGTFQYSRFFPDSPICEQFPGESGDTDMPQPQGIPFEECAERWYRNNKISWKPSVRADFRSALDRHLIPYFGQRSVTEIGKPLLKEFRTHLAALPGRKAKTISNKRINNILMVMRLVMKEVVEELDIPSPFSTLKPLKVAKTEVMPFTLAEAMQIIDGVPPDYRDYYIVRFFTGMRTAEVDGLQWQYVDFASNRIMVRTTWQARQWVDPKTTSSFRDIQMSTIVRDALLRQRGRTEGEMMVFCTPRSKPLDATNITKRIWYPTLQNLKLTKRTPYQTRHTAATLWLASGENPEWVARQLGHADTEMLFKVYSRFIPNLTRQDGSAFERMLNTTTNTEQSSQQEEINDDK